ncbi:MAG: DUF1178 family protein [Rhodobacteraceae bacterium]|jgi:hypothetical protein|uniref:DUF1178 family protein n=1 Tax=Albidovulum sp. TaxID=1872424 RepID=UPI001D46CA29|nr:DUF1178 family protein [uncultured Defluviimonas sp.]MCB2125701.1 DUF1178 family protein [Paracoccaceae bacterium]MCC0069066.1 DUF1178 family protein [Paracoccaceae bacterium]
MIRYSLTCSNDHAFESWFQSAEAFDRLAAAGHVACAVCGATGVAKTLMAPAVRPARKAAAAATAAGPLATPQSPIEAALAALRRQVEETSEYVGLNFAAEARAMHEGRVPERSIYGEAKADEARRLVEDGIPVAPLPFVPARKTN